MKKVVKRPSVRNGEWVIVIADGRGPLANEIEVVPCGGYGEAAKIYNKIKKELGQGF